MKRKLSGSHNEDDPVGPRVVDFGGNFPAERDSWLGNTFTVAGNVYVGSGNDTADNKRQKLKEIRQRLLDHLSFPEMEARQRHIENLVDDFGITCRWLVTPGSDQGFLHWLQHGDGLFWINGLPGTGKSTLMDFLDDHLRHDGGQLLIESASPKQPVVLKFFLISSKDSTDLQKTFVGLYRCLCHQLLKDDETLLYTLHEDRLSPGLPITLQTAGDLSAPEFEWSIRELKRLFSYFIKKSSKMIYLILDGLDEFAEDHYELLAFLQDSLDAGLRLCCASRPDDPYRTGLRNYRSVRLQDVNAKDIRSYCTRKLQATPALPLVEDIVTIAGGVFLWAAIVTLDLRRASIYCNMAQMRKRLEGCPTRMLDLYRHMVTRPVPDLSAEQVCVPYLKIIRTFLRLRDQFFNANITLLELLLADLALKTPDFYQQRGLSEDQTARLIDKAQTLENLVLIQCAGLVHSRKTLDHARLAQIEVTEQDSLLQSMRIDFIFVHKTALDFLDEDEVGRSFMSQTSVTDDETIMATLQAYWSVFHIIPLDSLSSSISEALEHLFRGLNAFADTLISNPAHRFELYESLKNVCEKVGSCIRNGDGLLESMCAAPRWRSAVYFEGLSFAEHVMYSCAAVYLDTSEIIEWMGLQPNHAELVGALVLQSWWNGWRRNARKISPKNMEKVLSLCRHDRVNSVLRISVLSDINVVVKCDLWTTFIAKLMTWWMNRGGIPELGLKVLTYRQRPLSLFSYSADHFLESGASLVNIMQFDLLMSWARRNYPVCICMPYPSFAGRLTPTQFVQTEDIDVSETPFLFRISVSPSWILGQSVVRERLTEHETPQPRFYSYEIPRIAFTRTLTESESARLASSMEKDMERASVHQFDPVPARTFTEHYKHFSSQICRLLKGHITRPVHQIDKSDKELIQTLLSHIKRCLPDDMKISEDDNDSTDYEYSLSCSPSE